MSVCLLVFSLAYLKNRRQNFTKFSVRVTCGRGSVLLWRQCDTLCTSGFVDDVIFSHNGPYGSWACWGNGVKCDIPYCIVFVLDKYKGISRTGQRQQPKSLVTEFLKIIPTMQYSAWKARLSAHKLFATFIRRCLLSRACDWVMSALSAVLLICSFQFRPDFLPRRSVRRRSVVLGLPNIGRRRKFWEVSCTVYGAHRPRNDFELIPINGKNGN